MCFLLLLSLFLLLLPQNGVEQKAPLPSLPAVAAVCCSSSHHSSAALPISWNSPSLFVRTKDQAELPPSVHLRAPSSSAN